MRTLLCLLVLLLMGAETTLFTQAPLRDPNEFATQSAANEYGLKVLKPIIDKKSEDPSESPALRRRLELLQKAGAERKIWFHFSPTYYFEFRSTAAGLSRNKEGRVILTIFTPVFREYSQHTTKAEFEDYVSLVFAHEVIHWELGESGEFPHFGRSTPEQQMLGEAKAWAITVRSIVRQRLNQGRRQQRRAVYLSELLTMLKDDATNPIWLEQFRDPNWR